MEIVLSDADLERMPNSLRVNLLSYLFAGLASAQALEAETLNFTINGFAYARLKLDGAGDGEPVVVLNDDQARELFDAIDIKTKKNDGDFAEAFRDYSNALKLLNEMAKAEGPERATPALLAQQLGFGDARQIGPILNSINKSLRKLTRNSKATLLNRDANSGGYVLHASTRAALSRAYEPFLQKIVSALQAEQAEREAKSGD